MPRNKDIKKVLVIGSGPIVIGQAAVRLCRYTGMPFFERGRGRGSTCKLQPGNHYDR